jgi:two-component system, chemotaxis family, chemotaxis protein CheY
LAQSVLICDDISFVRKTLETILTNAHYQVVGQAEDGEEAVRLYRQLSPDVVTMDLVMPKMSGIEAIREIIKKDNKAKIIVITAMDQESLIMEAIHAGAKDYLLKPFAAEDILKTLEHILHAGEGSSGGKV